MKKMFSNGITVLDIVNSLQTQQNDLSDSYIKVFKDFPLSEIDFGIPNQSEPDYEFYCQTNIERFKELKEMSLSVVKERYIVTVWLYDDDGFENGYETVIELYI